MADQDSRRKLAINIVQLFRKTTVLFVLCGFTILGIALTSIELSATRSNASIRVIRIQDVVTLIERIRRETTEMESLERAWLLFPDEKFNAARKIKVDHIKDGLSVLKRLTEGDIDQAQHLRTLGNIIDRHESAWRKVLDVSGPKGDIPERKVLAGFDPEKLDDVLKDNFDQLTYQEMRLLDIPSAKFVQTSDHLALLLGGLIVTAAAFAVALYADYKQRGEMRRTREREVLEANQRLTQSLESTHDAFMRLDRDWRYEYVNHEAERILGMSRQELVGNIIWHLSPQEIGGPFYENCLAAAKDQTPRSFETEMADGSWLEARVFPSPDGVSVYYRDISQAKTAQQSIEHARDEAVAANRAKSHFLATMSHEIRTPLNGVIGLTELLSRTRLTEEQRRFSAAIQASSQTLLRVINDILEISKIEAGRLSLDPRPIEVSQTLRETVELFAGKAAEKGLELVLEMPSLIDVPVVLDDIRLKQVLGNLVGNAVKFTDHGSVRVIAKVLDETEDRITFQFLIRDTGPGIPRDRVKAIFESFTQADQSMHRKYGGTGLGLTISRQIIEMMGGSIHVETIEGDGSTFQIDLPATKAAVGTTAENVLLGPDDEEEQSLKGLHILLAEDNEVNVMVSTALLDEMGCEVDVVSNGVEAVEASGAKKYDLILMDIQMPKMDGRTATRLIRHREKDAPYRIPIIALTASVLDEDRLECAEAGMDDFLAKPLRREEVVASILFHTGRSFYRGSEPLSITRLAPDLPIDPRPAAPSEAS